METLETVVEFGSLAAVLSQVQEFRLQLLELLTVMLRFRLFGSSRWLS